MRFKNLTQAEQKAIETKLGWGVNESAKDALVRQMRADSKAVKADERRRKASERRAEKVAKRVLADERRRQAWALRKERDAAKAAKELRKGRRHTVTPGVATKPRLSVAQADHLDVYGLEAGDLEDGFTGLRERDATGFECEASAEHEENEGDEDDGWTGEVDSHIVELSEGEKDELRKEIARYNWYTAKNIARWHQDYQNYRLVKPVVVHNCVLARRPESKIVNAKELFAAASTKKAVAAMGDAIVEEIRKNPPNAEVQELVQKIVEEIRKETTVINLTVNVTNVTNVTQVVVDERPLWERVAEAKDLAAIVTTLEEHGFRFGLVKPKTVAELRSRIEASPKWGSRPMEVIAKALIAEA